MSSITGSIVALITPFDINGKIDFSSLAKLVQFHLENRTNGIVFNGTTGESPTISNHEFKQIGNFILNQVNKKIPVIAGVGGNNTKEVLAKVAICEKMAVDGLLIVSPAYNKPTPKGISMYYSEIASKTELPIIMYNVPGRTSSSMPLDLIIELGCMYKNIIGIKEASGDIDRLMYLIQNKSNKFKIFTGDDSLALPTMLLGGDGCISVVANQIPTQFSTMIRWARHGKVKEARKIHYRYLNLMNLNFVETNPIPVKSALSLMGYCAPHFRSPLCEMEESNFQLLKQELVQLNLVHTSREHLTDRETYMQVVSL